MEIGGLHSMNAEPRAIHARLLQMFWLDPEEAAYVANITVWLRWLLWAAAVVEIAFRPMVFDVKYIPVALMHMMIVALNGYVHYRLLVRGRVAWYHLLLLSAMDMTLITVGFILIASGLVADAGFGDFLFLAYYPALATFAAVFTSALLNLTWTTLTASSYVGVSLALGSGTVFEGTNEEVLLSRVLAMFGVVLVVNFITRFQRLRARAAMERERLSQRERMEFSQTIHDTAAQTAYMIGLGIDAAKQVAGDANVELATRLDATSRLSKTAIWQLRHPMDLGRIFEGRGLGWTLDSHVATFRAITSMDAGMTQSGVEPPLSIEAKSRLFTIAHNALTNAFRHAEASRVLVGLDFGRDELRLSVSDDGVGLPDSYDERGHGFANMRADAERLGGRLIVEPRGPVGGASVTCVMPLGSGEQEA